MDHPHRLDRKRSWIGPASASFLAILLVLAATRTAPAASKPVLTKLAFVETDVDKLVCTGNPGLGVSCDTPFSDSFTITATVAGVFTGLTDNTTFELIFGGVDYLNSLGDDARYKTGKSTSATFVDTSADATGRSVVVDTIKLKWTANQLTVTIAGKATADYGSSIVAPAYDGTASGKITHSLTGSINFNSTTVLFTNVAYTGTVSTKTVHAKDGSNYPLSTISLKGSGTAP